MMYRQAAGDTMLEGPLTLRVQAYLQTPKSASKKKLTQMICGFILPTKTPDLDNIVKAVLDGLNKVAFSDDAQIVNIYAIKRYAAVAPGLTVQIEQYDPLGPEAAL
jgi:Holliday junction resolvase RusA-like endonuclease